MLKLFYFVAHVWTALRENISSLNFLIEEQLFLDHVVTFTKRQHSLTGREARFDAPCITSFMIYWHNL